MSLYYKIIDYLKSSRMELKYVNWPTKKTTLKFTILVIGVSAFITIFLGSLDMIFGYIISKFII